ncbi:hypothetical protein MMC22_004889 [Lobaria immixta]|nr:hypothetical protein [Lobaria immixta]
MPLPGLNGNDGSPEMTTNNSSSESYQIPRKPVVRISENVTPSPEQERYVKWGVAWKIPLLIVLWTLIGFSWAIAHHFYYQSLDGTKVGSSSRQNWAVGFGTAFTFLVIASLRVTCDTAYKQYLWTLFKRKPFALDTLNKLFSITSDPTAFLSWELFRHAKIAYFVAAVCWCMPLAGITPPATLSVVPGLWNKTSRVSWPLLNWDSSNFFDNGDTVAKPSSEVLQIATLAAESMAIIPPGPPAANSSFHVQFFGPTVQCSIANSSQQLNFDSYSSALANGSLMTVTKSLFESRKLAWSNDEVPARIAPLMNVYSAFSPKSGQSGGWFEPTVLPLGQPDEFNNWFTGLPLQNDSL